MKKVLALVVAFALCFTAVAGCFSVSATAPVISIETADTSFTVSGTNYTAKIAQITELTVQNGLAVLSIYNGDTPLVKYDEAKQNDDDRTNDEFDWVESTDEDGNTVIKFINIIEAGKSFAYTVNVDVDNAAYGDYKITATVEAGDYEAGEIVEVKSAEATFTKKAPHVCDFSGDYQKDATGHWKACTCGETTEVEPHDAITYAPNGNGTHNATCGVCGYVEENVTCTFGEYVDGTHTCTYCSYAEACVHNYGDYVSDGNGSHVATCATCGATDSVACTAGEPVEEDGYMVKYCTVCKAELSREEIKVECEHDWVVTGAEPSSATEPGQLNFTCSLCGEEDNNTVNYFGKYRFPFVGLVLESEILLSFENTSDRYGVKPDGVTAEFEDCYMVFKDADGNIVEAQGLDERIMVGTNATFCLPVASTDMALTYGSIYYACYGGVWYCGKLSESSVAATVTNKFAKADAEDKTLFVDMLNYGTAAQKHFHINEDVYANSVLTEEQLAYGTSEVTPEAAYTVPAKDSTQAVYRLSFSLNLQSKIIMSYEYSAKPFKQNNDISELTARVHFTDAFGIEHDEIYTFDDSTTELYEDEYFFTAVTVGGNKYHHAYKGFTAADLRVPITFSFYKGDVQVGETHEYSVENFIAQERAGASDTLSALFDAMLKYGDAAYVAFVLD